MSRRDFFLLGCVCSFILLFPLWGVAQGHDTTKINVVPLKIVTQETLPHVSLREVRVVVRRGRRVRDYRNTRRYWRIVRNIRVVTPYVNMGSEKINEINTHLANMRSGRERRKFIRSQYRDLMKEYKKPLMHLKISQGKLLMKLIHRQTGNTSYQHLKELKGSLNAFFWQSVALMFGSNLNAKYDPFGADWMVEEILLRMHRGEIAGPRSLYSPTGASH